MNLRAEMRAFQDAHPGREPDDLATMFARGCDVDDLLPLLVDGFRQLLRAEVRLAEIQAVRSATPSPIYRNADRLGDLAPLLDKLYRIGDGAPARPLGLMTIEEHQARLLMIQADIAGLQRSAEIHVRAIDLIQQHGVSCLDEIARVVEAQAA